MTKPEQIFGQPHRYIHSLDITIHVHILVYVGFIGIHIIAYLHTNIQTAKVLCIPIHIQSQQRYYMYPPHMIRCIIHVPMKQHRQRKYIIRERFIGMHCIHTCKICHYIHW